MSSPATPDESSFRGRATLPRLVDSWGAVWSARGILALCIALAARRGANTLTLPRPGSLWVGAKLMAAVWVLLYAVLVRAYGSLEHTSVAFARRLSLRLGIALLAALGLTEVARIVVNPLLQPLDWVLYHYLRLLVAPALAAFMCAVLLPRETLALARRVRRAEASAPVVALVALFLLAAVLVSASDLAFQLLRSGSAVEQQITLDLIGQTAWTSTVVILFLVLAIVFAVTSSAAAAALLVAPIYATMVFATLAKIRFIHSAVQPLDLLTLPEFMPLFGDFFGAWAIVASVVGVALWLGGLVFALRRMRTSVPLAHRGAMGVLSLVLLVVLIGAFLPPQLLPAPIAARSDALQAFAMQMGGTAGDVREEARSHGIVLNFLSELRPAFVTVPSDYSAERVQQTMARYTKHEATPAKRAGGINLVIYLVESLMDPNDLGLHYTAEPMPNFRAIAAEQVHGRAIVPDEFYASASTEFELLTGMSATFLPTGSIPYRQFVHRPLPALPRALRDLGYASIAIEAGPPNYYDRARVDPLLGFERTVWPYEMPNVKRADRGRWPSDDAMVDAVIEAAERARPFFVFAFPASTHSPYNRGTYARSDLDVMDAPTPAAAAEVKEYINAVRVADRAIGRLVKHFRGRPDSTIVVIMGDHLPPFSSSVLRLFEQRLSRLPAAERARAARATPLLVWANFTLPPNEITLSTNIVPAYLLELVGAPREILFAVTDSVRRTLPVASAVVQSVDGQLWTADSVPAALGGPLDDYRLVQHDLLLGRQFAWPGRSEEARLPVPR